MNLHNIILKEVQYNLNLIINEHDIDSNLKSPIIIQPTKNINFGDFQINGIVQLAKTIKKNPVELANDVAFLINQNSEILEASTINTFINLNLNKKFIIKSINQLMNMDLILKTCSKKNIVIDYSSPNIAKEMHVGHLRSSIIGDSIARVLKEIGHNVILQNHIGDWGTQFGMLIAMLVLKEEENKDFNLSDLESLYKQAKIRFDEDESFANLSREYVVKLQSNDEYVLSLWKKLIDISIKNNQQVYNKLDLLLKPEHIAGESKYNNDLQFVVNDLIDKKIAIDDNGTKVVLFPKQQSHYIVQKKDGGFLYATTDLACLNYRVKTLKADKILYVVDSRQKQHFEQLFSVAKMASYLTPNVQSHYIDFGTVLGNDKKPLKTRSGDSFKLNDLLDESIKRSIEVIQNNGNTSSNNEKIATSIGIASVKYADLSKNRTSDYEFDLDQMLNFNGNTASYLIYAYVRAGNILDKMNEKTNKINSFFQTLNKDNLETLNFDLNLLPIEKQLSVELLKFSDVVNQVAKTYYPHYLALYVYQIATLFSRFYEKCPIVNYENKHNDNNEKQYIEFRLKLVTLTKNTLQKGLYLLGINVENMDVM